jgi:mono/diheme cytochrome c family protein
MARTVLRILLVLAATASFASCTRGLPRESRNVVVIPDLETQKKLKAQGYTEFFEDKRTMRTPPAGTIAMGSLREDAAYYDGFLASAGETTYVHNPRPINEALLRRGQDRFNIYCTPCHDRTGSGKGIVANYGLVPPTDFHLDRSRAFRDGYIYSVISQGVRNMPAYGRQIPPDDRWAIVAYVRALQRSRTATLADVPPEAQRTLE